MTTLAEYNNNPGNIRPAKGVKYEGMIGVDDKGFAIFEAPKYGQQALINDITYKLEKRGIKTPEEFVDIYSPKSDENSEDARDNYKIYIAQKLGLKSTSDPFPENSVEKLSQAITNFEAGTWQEKTEDKKDEVPEIKPPTLPPAGVPNVNANAVPEINPLFGMFPGAGYGAAVGTGLAVADAKFNAASGAKQAVDSLLNRNPASAIEPPVTATVETPKLSTTTSPTPAVTPKHGGQNWVKSLTDVDLPAAQMSKADLDLAKGMQSAVGRSGETGFTGGKITPGGVIISPQTASAIDAKKTGTQKLLEDARLMREARAKIAQQAAEQTRAAEAAMLARGEGQVASTAATEAAERTSPLWHYIRRLASFPVKGAVAGAGAGFSALDALNRFNKKDYEGATISGLGGLAGSVAPFVGSMGALPSLGVAAPLYLSASDRIKYLKNHPEQIRLQEDQFDPMGNPLR